MHRAFCAILIVTVLPSAVRAAVTVRTVPASLAPCATASRETVAVVLRDTETGVHRVALEAPEGAAVQPASRVVQLEAGRETPVFFEVSFPTGWRRFASVGIRLDGRHAGDLPVGECHDLEAVSWRGLFDGDGVGAAEDWTVPDFDDAGWPVRTLPSMWHDVGQMYLRARLLVPETWRGRDLVLQLRAVDDADTCYLNGQRIGATTGWDTPREYAIDPAVVRYGEENLLCIVVDNTAYGGGVYRSPSRFGVAFPQPPPAVPVSLAPQGPLGDARPLRPMAVRDGVLYYAGGGEVALWGANYYPQSWYQYTNMKRLGVDMQAAIRTDLDDLREMGVEAIRIHVFDREIADGSGELVDNEHLDLLDYLIAEGTARGLYFFFTPIAWWYSPEEIEGTFSARTPKEYMWCDDAAIAAQAAYARNWLNHINRYTGRRYRDEPAICVFEIMNEPAYVDYDDLMDDDAAYYDTAPEVLAPFKQRLRAKWQDWCAAHGTPPDRRFFPLFRYAQLRRYLETMHAAFRDAGARQPVACALFDTTGQDDLIAAIADSPCEAVTTGTYAGSFDRAGDGTDLLPAAKNEALDGRLNGKARLVYEFDALKTMGSYMYPALARRFRHQGVQVCCMFQYDSRATAEWNTDWDAHYLNLYYTPGKAVSFQLGGLVFDALARGATYPDQGAEQTFAGCAVSFERGISLYATEAVLLHSGPLGDWRPLELPERPRRIAGVGDSPHVSYAGTGAYALELGREVRSATLTVFPDALLVGDPWHPDASRSAVVLREATHPFALRQPGIALREVRRLDDGATLSVTDNEFTVAPGRYLLRW